MVVSSDDKVVTAIQLVVDRMNQGQRRGTILTYDPWSDASVLAELDVLARAVEAHEDLAPVLGHRVFSADRGSHRIDAVNLARRLASRAWGGGAQLMFEELRDFVRKRATSATIVYCLYGIRVPERVDLSDQVALVPPKDVPACRERDRFFEPISDQIGYSSIFGPQLAAAALVVRTEIAPAISESTEDDGWFEKLIAHFAVIDDANIERAFASLVLAGAKVQLGVRFATHEHPGYPGTGSSVTWKSLPDRHMPALEFDASGCVEIFRLCQQFDGWPDLHRLIQRLARARRQSDPVDTHLDFGIVAESVLTRGDSSKSEVLNRLKTRAAWLLGDSPAARRAVAARADRLYDLRSSAAHGGKLPSTGRNAWGPNDKNDADNLCTQLLNVTLGRGQFFNQSDWGDIVYG